MTMTWALTTHAGIFTKKKLCKNEKIENPICCLKIAKNGLKIESKSQKKNSFYPFFSQNPPKTTKNSFFFYKKKF